jgi:hypothetical protein
MWLPYIKASYRDIILADIHKIVNTNAHYKGFHSNLELDNSSPQGKRSNCIHTTGLASPALT